MVIQKINLIFKDQKLMFTTFMKGGTNGLAGPRSWAMHGKKEREREAGIGWGRGFSPREVWDFLILFLFQILL
jgi:hypothetical protein